MGYKAYILTEKERAFSAWRKESGKTFLNLSTRKTIKNERLINNPLYSKKKHGAERPAVVDHLG